MRPARERGKERCTAMAVRSVLSAVRVSTREKRQGGDERRTLRLVLNNLLSPPAFFCLSSSFWPEVLLVIPDALSLSAPSSNRIAAVLDPRRSTSFSSPFPAVKFARGDDVEPFPLNGSSFARVSTGLVGTLLVRPASRPSSLSSLIIGLFGFRRPARKRAARDFDRFGLLAGEVSEGDHS
jgi:hypothetical protein